MEKICPFTKKKCIESKCMFWTRVLGMNPQTGQNTDEFNCAISLIPILLIENSNQQRQTQKAVESLRNDVVGAVQTLLIIAKKYRELK